MREHLYRGKRKDSGKLVYGDLYHHESGAIIITSRGTNYEVIPETVGQFTGLTNKEGKKVFEGDILKSLHFISGKKKRYLYHIVKWSKKLTGWQCINTGNVKEGTLDSTAEGNPQLWVYAKAEFEVVGNIHDNPELLEGVNRKF